MPRIRVVAVLSLIFLSAFLSLARADKVLLKNGNILEGRVAQEEAEAIWLELDLGSGKAQTRILKAEIKSIKPGPPSEEEAKKAKSPTERIKIQKPAPGAEGFLNKTNIPAPDKSIKGLPTSDWLKLTVAFITLISLVIIMIKRKKAPMPAAEETQESKFGRPLGVKVICFLINSWAALALSLGLMLLSFVINKVFIDLGARSSFLFCILAIGLPVFLFILSFGLFYLRSWARIILIICFSASICLGAASLVLGKNIAGKFLQGLAQKTGQGVSKVIMKGALAKSAAQSETPLEPNGRQDLGAYKPINILSGIIFSLLFMLYLVRRKTREAFREAGHFKLIRLIKKKTVIIALFSLLILGFLADRLYQFVLIKKTHNPYLFTRPIKSKGVIEGDLTSFKSLAVYEALGHRFYLPKGMQRYKGSEQDMAIFINNEEGRVFSLNKVAEDEFRIAVVSNYARWNPVLLITKAVGMPGFDQLTSLKEVRFQNYRGLLWEAVNKKKKERVFVFILGGEKGDQVQCMLVSRVNDNVFDENNALSIAASIEKLP